MACPQVPSGSRLMYRIGLLIALLAAICIGEARAESPPFKTYTTEEGLAHDSVNEIVRDSRGFLWFCTAEGLSRFDGSRFVSFTQNHGLPHRIVRDILELRDGTYLIATSAGVVEFDPLGRPYVWDVTASALKVDSEEPPMFKTFVPQTDNRQKKVFHTLAQTPDGTVWAGSANGLFRLSRSGSEWLFEEVEPEPGKILGIGNLLPDSKGGLIITSGGGMYRLFDDRMWKFADHGAACAMETRDGRIWVGAGGHEDGIRIFEINGPTPELVQTLTEKDGLPEDTFQYDIEELGDGRIYIGQWVGLSEYLPEAGPNEPKFKRLNTDSIHTLAEDPVGDLWYGTEYRGASKMVRTGFTTFGPEDGLSETVDIRSIYINSANNMFLPTRPVDILHFNGQKFEPVLPLGLTQRSWGWRFVDFQSKSGEWWIPAYNGLRRYPNVARFSDLAKTAPIKVYTTADGLPVNEVFMLFEDSRGDIWITTSGTHIMSRWDRQSERIAVFTEADGLPTNNGSVSFAEDRTGNVWMGFYFGGVARFRGGRFDWFTEKDGLPESMSAVLFTDADGRLWIGTSGRGLFRVDQPSADRPIFISVSKADGLSSNQIICMTDDRFGRLYVGTGRGINRIEKDGKIKVFTQSDGLPSNYITQCATDKLGYLWFLSGSTLVKFLPDVAREAPTPPVYIDRVSVNGVPQKISALGETEVRLPEFGSDQHQVQVGFYALTFGSGEDVLFQYKLDDQDWSAPSNLQTLNLDLSPGSHQLNVRAIRSDGAISDRIATAAFKILPPIWARGWFIAVSVVLVAAIILGVFYYRTDNLKRINTALLEANRAEEALRRSRDERVAELEAVRSRIATDLHDDIGSSLTQIAVLSEVAQTQMGKSNGHPEVLRKITDVSNELVGTMSDIVWAINPAKDHFSDLTQRMRRIAADLLSPKGIAVHFRSREEDRALRIKTNERREIFLIFKESVNNIAKHSGAKNVEIDLEIDGEILILRISDDGNGFVCGPPSFEDTFSSAGQGGNGIRNMRKRASELGGRFDIDSAPGRGTTTYLAMPLEPRHAAER